MTPDRGESAWRLFVAAYPPPTTARAWRESLASRRLEAVRLVEERTAHLTMLFLGPRARRDVDGIIESIERASAGVREEMVTARRWTLLPPRGGARIVAVELESPGWLVELHERLARRLSVKVAGGKYVPHVTIGRVRAGMSLGGEVDVGAWGAPGGGVDPSGIRLVRSVLGPGGAEHVEVWRRPEGRSQ